MTILFLLDPIKIQNPATDVSVTGLSQSYKNNIDQLFCLSRINFTSNGPTFSPFAHVSLPSLTDDT